MATTEQEVLHEIRLFRSGVLIVTPSLEQGSGLDVLARAVIWCLTCALFWFSIPARMICKQPLTHRRMRLF